MPTLLVTNGEDLNELVHVGPTGRYYGTVHWDTRLDGQLPQYDPTDFQGLERSGNTLVINVSKRDERNQRVAEKEAQAQARENERQLALQAFRRIDNITTLAQAKDFLKILVKYVLKIDQES